MEFSELIKQTREAKFSSAKEFHRKAKLPCSYFYYSKVENGTVPEVNLAVTIINALGLNLRKGLYAWVRGQMPDKETKSYFTELGDQNLRSTEQMSIDRSFVVNRMQASFLETNPILWEILLIISNHYQEKNLSEKEISKILNLSLSKCSHFLNELYEFGLINKDKMGCYFSKEWIFIPYETEFDKLRDQNFKRAVDQFYKQKRDNRFRTTITRPITNKQKKEIEAMVLAFANAIVDLPEEKDGEPYTVGVFSSPRIFGHD